MACGEEKDKDVGGVAPADGACGSDAANMDDPMDLDPKASSGDPPIQLDERIQNLLGRKLSRYYSTLVSEPVPDNFVELLRRLEKKEAGQ